MNQLREWQNMIEKKFACNEISGSRLFLEMREKQIELYQQLEHYKSMVKKIDPDNLPDDRALCVGDIKKLLSGQIDVSSAVKFAMAMRGVNQTWLAEKMMITQGGLSLALRRGTLSSAQLYLIAKALDLKASDIIALGEDK